MVDYHPDGAQPDHYDRPIFQALLQPYRSLGRKGFIILMSALIACWLLVSFIFFSLGAWPIFGFFGLDIALIYWAFRVNYRAAQAREEISVSKSELHIRQIAASGRIQNHSFNPFWTKFHVDRRPDIGITAMNIESRGRILKIGSFLNADDRESFANAFSSALHEAKSN
ncbi:DUF2244 domain-containing protein [Paenochrobactrum sp. BZR 588]|uniref:DUF2244 domain-containing protein n=1 Tax=unclassified Paenochrobactrum TaxID=2639760 RepID=UPI003854DAE9